MSDPLELGRVTDRRPPYKYSALTRVWFSDTDAQGVVYYGRYLPYFDHARTEYHRHLGWAGVEGAEFVMRASNVEYHAPGPLRRPRRVLRPREPDRALERHVRGRRGRAPRQTLMVTGTQTLVLIDQATRLPVEIPEPCASRSGRSRASDLVE